MSSPLKIDYKSIPNQANRIRNTALEINDRILDVYKQVAEMHTHWYGKRYNELVSKFNELAP